jgi:NAD-dependent deacetylase
LTSGPYHSVFVLTGAGISAPSGLKTFRGEDGLWEGHALEEVATPEAFARDRNKVFRFYNERRRQLQSGQIQPNDAHFALADFARKFKGDFYLVTQNVDNLHERAGSKKVTHLHGELLKARCLDTGHVFDWLDDLDENSAHPKDPQKRGRLRPHVVWFGEIPLHINKIQRWLTKCDLFVAIGTSGVVYPAANFVQQTLPDCHRVQINLEETPVGPLFQESIVGNALTEVREFFQRVLSE